MALLTETERTIFDLAEIARGYLLWGRHCTWEEGKAGFVTSATEEQLIVQFHPGIGNVTNHFIIPASEAADGQWEIRWSADLSDIQEYGLGADDSQQETEKTEGDEGGDDIGGIDP